VELIGNDRASFKIAQPSYKVEAWVALVSRVTKKWIWRRVMAKNNVRLIFTQALVETLNPMALLTELANLPPAGITKIPIHCRERWLLQTDKGSPASAPKI
jgi:hypothetical protein